MEGSIFLLQSPGKKGEKRMRGKLELGRTEVGQTHQFNHPVLIGSDEAYGKMGDKKEHRIVMIIIHGIKREGG